MLEIGCGWGGFAEYAAAERGATIDGITISQAQHDFATRRIAAAGLSDKAHIRMRLPRSGSGYVLIISMVMSKLDGEAYWLAISRPCQKVRKQVHAALQVITNMTLP